MSTYFAPTKFVWRLGGNQVHLCGSFTRWVETVPMVPEEGQPGVFSVVVHLPPGYHQYKFIVDGEWRHDEAQPFMPDPLGNVNNWLFVRKPENQDEGVPHLPVDSAHDMSTGLPSDGRDIQSQAGLNSGVQLGGALMASLAGDQEKEPLFTKSKVKEFLSHHTASELIPESGKVVLLDIDLPLRQALHALHEQGAASAPLFDPVGACISGIISASDFITTLQHLKLLASESSNPMSEAEMDQHTIRGLREELSRQGNPPKPLVCVQPEDSLQHVVDTLLSNHCSMVPVVRIKEGVNPIQGKVQDVLHNATLGGVMACLLRHFRSSLSMLPLLAQPLESLPLGTWSLDSDVAKSLNQGKDSSSRNFSNLATVNPSTLLTEAFRILVEGGFSCVPVVDDEGMLVDIYARSDITTLAKANAYSRLQFEDVTVGQALSLASQPNPPALLSGPGNKQQTWAGTSPSTSQASINDPSAPSAKHRVHACTNKDPLRLVMERLAMPGVRRLLIVNPENKKLEGIVSLSDVARFLLT